MPKLRTLAILQPIRSSSGSASLRETAFTAVELQAVLPLQNASGAPNLIIFHARNLVGKGPGTCQTSAKTWQGHSFSEASCGQRQAYTSSPTASDPTGPARRSKSGIAKSGLLVAVQLRRLPGEGFESKGGGSARKGKENPAHRPLRPSRSMKSCLHCRTNQARAKKAKLLLRCAM